MQQRAGQRHGSSCFKVPSDPDDDYKHKPGYIEPKHDNMVKYDAVGGVATFALVCYTCTLTCAIIGP